jgi:hypothetical protein
VLQYLQWAPIAVQNVLTAECLLLCTQAALHWSISNLLQPEDKLHIATVTSPVPFPVMAEYSRGSLPMLYRCCTAVSVRDATVRCYTTLKK